MIIVLLASAFSACQENIIHLYRAVDSKAWSGKSKATFHITDIKQDGVYRMAVEVRLDRHFQYKDLWLVVGMRNSRGQASRDTLQLNVVDAFDELDGKGRNILEYELPYRQLNLQKTDTLDVSIRQIVSAAPIAGIHHVGILLEPSR